jgi:hypothetical protein
MNEAVLGYLVFTALTGYVGYKIGLDSADKSERMLLGREIERESALFEEIKTAKALFEAEKNSSLKLINNHKEAFENSYINGLSYLTELYEFALSHYDDAEQRKYRYKKNPAVKCADQLKESNKEKRNALRDAKLFEFKLKAIYEIYPQLEEFEEEVLSGELVSLDPESITSLLTKEEYEKLQPKERLQLALDRYMSRMSKSAIGKVFELYVGQQYENDGWHVDYHGLEKGLEDLGMDLICFNGTETVIVQAKYWSSTKQIHEKHILQLYGSLITYKIEHEKLAVSAILITHTKLSEQAKKFAKMLGIKYKEAITIPKQIPIIKCHIANGNMIYHLPFDQQYYKTKMNTKKGDRYVSTIEEAEMLGFRHAMRYQFGRS